MTSFYTRRFCSEFRVAIEEFGQYLRWDVLPELPRLVLVFGALAFFIFQAHQTPVRDFQTAETQVTCPVDAIAISTEMR
jgi:hypothetical protein